MKGLGLVIGYTLILRWARLWPWRFGRNPHESLVLGRWYWVYHCGPIFICIGGREVTPEEFREEVISTVKSFHLHPLTDEPLPADAVARWMAAFGAEL